VSEALLPPAGWQGGGEGEAPNNNTLFSFNLALIYNLRSENL